MSDTGAILAALKRIEEKIDALVEQVEAPESDEFDRLEAAIQQMHERAREKR